MKITRENIIDAILILAKTVGQEDNFRFLSTTNTALERISDMIIIQLFMYQFDRKNCKKDEFYAYSLLLDFYSEIYNKKG